MTDKLVDPFPIGVLFVLFAIFSLACLRVGSRIGRWWQRRMPGEQEGRTDMLVGSLLALMAFLLAVTMGIASDRSMGGARWRGRSQRDDSRVQADYLPRTGGRRVEGARTGSTSPFKEFAPGVVRRSQ